MANPPEQADAPRATRLAPSPTGALHLGNARTFLINWAMARRLGWRVILRIEDLDTPRTKAGADAQAIEDLRWLGMDYDDGPFYQSRDLLPYQQALAKLRGQGLLYPCRCTRREIVEAQSAPHEASHELRYPGTCRPAACERRGEPLLAEDERAWRVLAPDEDVSFTDQWHGPQRVNVQQQVGDFVVATKAGLPAYQLAVVVDDARQGVTDVVRGDDLLLASARQILLYRMLGLGEGPRWWHAPLVLGHDGRRLAKRHGDTRIAWYRQQGAAPERVVGLVAWWSGASDARRAMSAAELIERFDPAALPMRPVTFTEQDHDWLLDR